MKFYDIFNELCKQKGVTPTQVGRDIGVRQSTISMWKLQNSTPNPKTLQKIANYFGVSTEFLLMKDLLDFDLHQISMENRLNNISENFKQIQQVYMDMNDKLDKEMDIDESDINYLKEIQSKFIHLREEVLLISKENEQLRKIHSKVVDKFLNEKDMELLPTKEKIKSIQESLEKKDDAINNQKKDNTNASE